MDSGPCDSSAKRGSTSRIAVLALGSFSILLSVCILVPAPNLTFLPLTVAVPELTPWLAAGNLAAAAMAALFYRRAVFYRRAMPVFLASLLLAFGLLAQVRPVQVEMNRQMEPFQTAQPAKGRDASPMPAATTLAAIFRDSFRGIPLPRVATERLPMNILFYHQPYDRSVAPPAKTARPAVIDIYGGAWQRGSPEDNRDFHRYLLARGYAVFAIDYRHAPAAQFPAQIHDVQAAISFILSSAAEFNVDPRRVVLCGHSSGAQLALLAAYQGIPVDDALIPIAGVISFYGPPDLAAGYSDVPSPDPIHVRAVLEAYLGGTPAQVAGRYRDASPVTYVREGLPPTLLIQGGRDHIVKPRFARELYRKLIDTGNRAYLLEIPWSEHAFDAVFRGVGNQLALFYVDEFLSEVAARADNS